MVMGGLEWPELPSHEGFHTFKTRVIKHHNYLMVFGYPEQMTPLASTGDRRLYPLHKAILFQLHGTYCTTCTQCKLKSFKISYENQSFKLPYREKERWSIGCHCSHGNVPYCSLSHQENILWHTQPRHALRYTVHTLCTQVERYVCCWGLRIFKGAAADKGNLSMRVFLLHFHRGIGDSKTQPSKCCVILSLWELAKPKVKGHIYYRLFFNLPKYSMNNSCSLDIGHKGCLDLDFELAIHFLKLNFAISNILRDLTSTHLTELIYSYHMCMYIYTVYMYTYTIVRYF